jgi:hypothetical protein
MSTLGRQSLPECVILPLRPLAPVLRGFPRGGTGMVWLPGGLGQPGPEGDRNLATPYLRLVGLRAGIS